MSTCPTETVATLPESEAARPPARGRHPVVIALALSAGTAALVGAEFIPAGVLPGMAADLAVTEGQAGLTIAATALAGALTAPTIASLLPRTDRRTVLLTLLLLAIISNAIVAVAPTLTVVLAARVLLGIAIAGFWSFALSVGVQVTGKAALVSTTVALGTSTATIIGVPVSSVLGDIIGWRAVFLVISVLTLAAGVVLWRMLPPVPAQPGAGLAMMRAVLTNRRLVLGVAVIFVAAFANFIAYPYIRVAIEEIDAAAVSVLLLAWGLGGLLGNLAGGYLSSRWLRWAATAGPAIFAIALAMLASTDQTWVLAAAVILWGVGFNMVPVTTQLWVSAIEPRRVESAMALQVTAFQVAIMTGAVVGGVLVDSDGPAAAMTLGACVAGLAAIGFASIRVRPRTV
ncbi:MFS transporter [Brachybacterium sp. FME24]|uniref:MFS transporter n=1 Tax=Brachybacterium sp. FME24 TaxID=2742605 RepID=UPI001867FA13|nr:MFS transporter [Brachybacterium sp. FME24]